MNQQHCYSIQKFLIHTSKQLIKILAGFPLIVLSFRGPSRIKQSCQFCQSKGESVVQLICSIPRSEFPKKLVGIRSLSQPGTKLKMEHGYPFKIIVNLFLQTPVQIAMGRERPVGTVFSPMNISYNEFTATFYIQMAKVMQHCKLCKLSGKMYVPCLGSII